MAKAKKQPAVEQIPETFQRMLDQAIFTLTMLNKKFGVDFVVYDEARNIEHGTLDLIKQMKNQKRAAPKLAYGTVANYYHPFIRDLQPDELVVIPAGGLDPFTIQSGVSSTAVRLWGKGSVTCVVTKDKSSVEVWRLPEQTSKNMLLHQRGRSPSNMLLEDLTTDD